MHSFVENIWSLTNLAGTPPRVPFQYSMQVQLGSYPTFTHDRTSFPTHFPSCPHPILSVPKINPPAAHTCVFISRFRGCCSILSCVWLWSGYLQSISQPAFDISRPKLATLTLWYEFYCDVIERGRFAWEIKRMPEVQGKLSVSSSTIASTMTRASRIH